MSEIILEAQQSSPIVFEFPSFPEFDFLVDLQGQSLYQKWLELGNTGDHAAFLTWLKIQGDSAYTIAVQNGYVGTQVQWLASLKTGIANTLKSGVIGTAPAQDVVVSALKSIAYAGSLEKNFRARVVADAGTFDPSETAFVLAESKRQGLLQKASLILTPSGYKVSKLHSIVPKSGAADMTVVRATTATRVNEEGVIETVAANFPRIDYSNGSASLIIEPQRSNLLNYSEQFDDASWSKTNSTVASNSTVSPNGLITSDTVSNSNGLVGSILKQITVANDSITYCGSIFVKKQIGFLVFQIRFINGTSTGCAIHFNKLTGEFLNINSPFGFTGVPINIKVESYGDYFRFSYCLANNGTGNTILRIEIQQHRGNSLGNLSQTDGFAVFWGAQIEAGSYPTSYIPTVASAVTRNADVISKTGIVDLINSAEGVLFFEGSTLENVDSDRFISISDGTTNNYIQLRYDSSASTILFRSFTGGVGQAGLVASIVKKDNNKIACVWGSTFKLFVNGVKVSFGTHTPPLGLNKFSFDSGSSGSNFNGNCKSIQVFKTALTDAECIALTTL